MEEIKQLLSIALKYKDFLGKFSWKIIEYSKKREPYTELDISDIGRQFSDISEYYLNALLLERSEKISKDDVLSMLKLVEFARSNAKKEYQTFSELSYSLLFVLTQLNYGDYNQFEVSAMIMAYEKNLSLTKRKKQQGWSKFIRVLSLSIKQLKDNNTALPTYVIENFLNSISKKPEYFTSIDLSEFLESIDSTEAQHNVSYLLLNEKISGSKEELKSNEFESNSIEELHKSLKVLLNGFDFEKFEESKTVILKSKIVIINTLTTKLIGDYENVREPKKAINADNRFADAKKLILSPSEPDRKRGFELFREISRNRNVPAFAVKPWLNYAEYRVDPITASRNWEIELDNGTAGWEVRWNLAVVYLRFKQPFKALQALKNITNAPFNHLKFALYIALEIYKTSKITAEYSNAINFLLEHLVKLPIAECYLVHLLLKLENNNEINLMEYEYLVNYIKVCDKNIQLLDPKKSHDNDSVNVFQHDIIDLNLIDTWLIWIKDYAESHYLNPFAWILLSEAYLKKNDKSNAEKALKHNINVEISKYNNSKGATARYLRYALLDLFDFYIKQALTDNAKSAIQEYKPKFEQLWDFRNNENSKLIYATRRFLPADAVTPKKGLGASIESSDLVWVNLNEPISKIHTLSELSNINLRIIEAFKVFKLESSPMEEKKQFFQEILNDLISIDHHKNTEAELKILLNSINSKLKTANEILSKNAILNKLKPLNSCFNRVFETINKSLKIHNKPIVGSEILGNGIPNDTQETSLLVNISNTSEGNIDNLEISCSNSETGIRSTEKYRLKTLFENTSVIAAIPVFVEKEKTNSIDHCTLQLNFSWGQLINLSDRQDIQIKWFSFLDYIHKFEKNKHEFIKLFIDDPINFVDHDNSLFQGRTEELDLIYKRFIDSKDFQPIYFHGTRKVGKTSLLKKIEIDFRDSEIRALYIDLSPINPTKGLDKVVSTITEYLHREARNNNLIDLATTTDSIASGDPLIIFEKFIEKLYTNNGNRRFIILLDEFQLICHTNTIELLDLFRRLTNNGIVSFILSGLLRPEIIRKQSKSQFSFYPFAVDFLKFSAVEKLLTIPLSSIGLQFHDFAIKLIFKLTSGHPFHISKVVQFCTDILNHEHRTLVVENDVFRAAQLISKDDYVFGISSFSDLVLSPDEKNSVTKVAKEISNNEIGISLTQAIELSSAELLTVLQQKFLIESVEGKIKIKGDLLWMYLKNRIISSEIIQHTEEKSLKKLGIFIDFENISFISENTDLSVTIFLQKLIGYYSKLGRIVCKWSAAFDFKHENKVEFHKTGFEIRGEGSVAQKWKKREKDVADFILLEIISEETSLNQPEIFVIVAGDIDYFEKIKLLNKQGYYVRLAGSKSKNHISNTYFEYYDQRKAFTIAEGGTIDQIDFVIDDLDEIITIDN